LGNSKNIYKNDDSEIFNRIDLNEFHPSENAMDFSYLKKRAG